MPTVDLSGEQASFLSRALEYLAERVRDHPDDPELHALDAGSPADTLALLAAVESAVADAIDLG
jgi:hypothetical protein